MENYPKINRNGGGNYGRRKRKRNNRPFILLVSLTVVLMVAVVLLIVAIVKGFSPEEESSQVEESSLAPLSSQISESSKPEEPSSAPESSSTSQSSKPASGSVNDLSYFDDAAFIGNSRTEGLMLSQRIPNATFYASKGLTVDTALTKALVSSSSGKLTIPEAMATQKFGKVYIMLGMNELGWGSTSTFIKRYSNLIDEIESLQPNAKIYVQSILPVTQEKSDSDKIYNNSRITEFNTLIKAMCKDKGITYLNVAEGVSDANGVLPADSSSDGVHLKPAFLEKWVDYLRDHTK